MTKRKESPISQDASIETDAAAAVNAHAAEIAAEINAGGFCLRTDRAVLVGYLESYKLMMMAREHLKREGPVMLTSKGTGSFNPWYSVWTKQTELNKKLGVELGLTPRARKTMGVKGAAVPNMDDIYGSPPGQTDGGAEANDE